MDISRLEIGAVDSGDGKKWTPVQFAGAVGEYSRISADGKVRPFSDKLNLELKSTLKGLDMQRLSAYTAGKLGQNVRSGQLDSDIDLKITDDQLDGHAKIVARQLMLKPAEQRESSELNQELGMPIDSALDMLRDSDDNIRLELPISGDIRNPDFDLTATINKAIGKAMRSAALNYAVYALQPYGAVIGVIRLAGKAGEAANRLALAPIEFDPGSATLRSDIEPYLTKLSTMLKERPQLQVQICGLATEGDRQALQASQPAPKESSDGKSAQLPAIPDESLLQLAEARAAAVKRQLVDRGSAPERLFVCQPEIDRSAEAKASVRLLL
jgi:outer membrane protein OmpA-like peptidoglycan-associated protein